MMQARGSYGPLTASTFPQCLQRIRLDPTKRHRQAAELTARFTAFQLQASAFLIRPPDNNFFFG